MSPPQHLSVAELSRRTGVTEPTLYGWRNQARSSRRPMPVESHDAEQWKAQDKFAVVVGMMCLSGAERAEYCGRKSLYVEQIERWNKARLQANAIRVQPRLRRV